MGYPFSFLQIMDIVIKLVEGLGLRVEGLELRCAKLYYWDFDNLKSQIVTLSLQVKKPQQYVIYT